MRNASLLLLLVFSGSAAAEWTPVKSPISSFSLYADLATIRVSGNIADMRSLYDYKAPAAIIPGMEYLSMKRHDEFDCEKKQMRQMSYEYYEKKMGTGKVIFSDQEAGKWQEIVANSSGEAQWKVACKK